MKAFVTALSLLVVIFAADAVRAQTPQPSPSAQPSPQSSPTTQPTLATTTILLSASYGSGKPAARKHFYLSRVDFNFDELQKDPKLGNLPSYKDYQQKVIGPALSEQLVSEFVEKWLKAYNCETVYCRPIKREDVTNIRLFQDAYAKSSAIFKTEREPDGQERALKWLPNFLPEQIRTGYFDMRRKWIQAAIELMEQKEVSVGKDPADKKNSIRVVMTDNNGTVYISNVKPGTYFISNLIPFEFEGDCFLWDYKKVIEDNPALVSTASLPLAFIARTPGRVKEVKGAGGAALSFTCAPRK